MTDQPMAQRILQITPGLAPAPEAVGQYAVILGRRLAERSGGELVTRHVAAGHARQEIVRAGTDAVNLTGALEREALIRVVRDTASGDPEGAVVLHYVGYGYAPRGAPLWLLRAIRALRTGPDPVPLYTVFHELFARGGRPWNSSFWLAPAQRIIAAEIARLSDGLLTNCRAFASWLGQQRPASAPVDSVQYSPTYSNVGEPSTVVSWADRPTAAVVFGRGVNREAVFQSATRELRAALDRLGIAEVWDIGPDQTRRSEFLGRPVRVFGVVSSTRVSELLQQARIGLLKYKPDLITKSGVVAAYLAHGVAPVILEDGPRADVREQPPYLRPAEVTPERSAAVGGRGHAWYGENAHSSLAGQKLLGLLVRANRTRSERTSSLH